MRDRRISKEWLSLHQCIDEHCPVHFNFNNHPVTGDTPFPKTGQSNQKINSEYIHNNLATNTTHQHERKLIAELAERESGQKEDINVVSGDLSYVSGALRSTSRCYEDATVTYNPSNSLKTLMHDYRDETEEALNATEGINGSPSKRVTEIGRPRFLCTWLDKHANLNNYPFYKLAVHYGSLNTVRSDAAIYSRFVTSQIWTSHKYIGSVEDVTETDENTIISRSKSSRSHDYLPQSVDSIPKDIPDIDISDLKLKYGFLFNPDYIFKRSGKDNRENKIQNEDIGAQKVYQDLNHNIRIENNDCVARSLNVDNFAPPKAYVNQYFNGSFLKENDGNQSNPEKQQTLNNNYDCSELNSAMLKADQAEGCNNSSSRSASNIGVDTSVCSSNLTRHRNSPARKLSTDSTNTRRDQFINNENIATVFCDNPGRPTGFNIYINNSSVPSSDIAAHCSEATISPYLRDSDLGTYYITENSSFHQTPSISSPFSSHNTGSPYQTHALTVSPMVSSPAFSHYVSPAGHLKTQVSTDHLLHYYTKLNKDPRLQVSTSDCNTRSGTEHIVSTPDHLSFADSSVYSTYDKIQNTHHDQYSSRSRGSMHADDRQRTRSKEQHRQSKFYNEDEDPLNGLDIENTAGQQSPDRYMESPNSDVFYRINRNKNQEEQCVDNVMDLFYAEKCYDKADAGRTYSPFVNTRHRSPLPAQYRKKSSRSTRSLRDVISRGWSRSQETSLPGSRQYRSHRFRRSKSPLTVRNRRYDSKHSRHSVSPEKNRNYLSYKESSLSRTDRRRHGNSTSYKRKAENQYLSYTDIKHSRRHERRTHDYVREKKRISKSPDYRSLRRTESHKRDKTKVRSSNTDDSRRSYHRKTTMSSRRRNEKSRRHPRCTRRR